MRYYITYKNLNHSEKTPIIEGDKNHAERNRKLLKVQGATFIKIHWGGYVK